MNTTKLNRVAFAVIMAMVAGFAIAQSALPSDEALNRAMQAAQKKAGSVLGEAERQTLPGGVTMPRTIPNFEKKGGMDPLELAEQYKKLGKSDDSDSPELMIFVSLSMPEEALKRIGKQAKQAGAVVVFRGLKHGMRNGGWNQSMEALKPIASTGADIQIHPELFTRYSVTQVPTMVVSSVPKAGCQDDACASNAASVVGDVSLDYALERLTDRKDAIGEIARERVKRLKRG